MPRNVTPYTYSIKNDDQQEPEDEEIVDEVDENRCFTRTEIGVIEKCVKNTKNGKMSREKIHLYEAAGVDAEAAENEADESCESESEISESEEDNEEEEEKEERQGKEHF